MALHSFTKNDLRNAEDSKVLRKEINRRNRMRAKEMERRLAKVFYGHRTPMSGAGYVKGDCNLPLPNNAGAFMVECKLSSMRTLGKPFFTIFSDWFPKIEREYKAMRSKFGMLAIHFHNVTGDYFFLHERDIEKVNASVGTAYTFMSNQTIDRYTLLSGKERKTVIISREEILPQDTSQTIPHVWYQDSTGRYAIIDSLDFKRWLYTDQFTIPL